jgi:hypothetical protein
VILPNIFYLYTMRKQILSLCLFASVGATAQTTDFERKQLEKRMSDMEYAVQNAGRELRRANIGYNTGFILSVVGLGVGLYGTALENEKRPYVIGAGAALFVGGQVTLVLSNRHIHFAGVALKGKPQP